MDEIKLKLDSLEKLIGTVQQDLNTNQQIFLACIGLVAALSIPAIVFYVKSVVNQRVENELIKMKEHVKNEIKLELSQYTNKRKHFKWVSGSGKVLDNYEIILYVDISEREFNTLPWQLEIYYKDHPDKIITYSAIYRNGDFVVRLKEYDSMYGDYVNFKMTWLSEEILDN